MTTSKLTLTAANSQAAKELAAHLTKFLGAEPKVVHQNTTEHGGVKCLCCEGGISKSYFWANDIQIEVDPCTSSVGATLPADMPTEGLSMFLDAEVRTQRGEIYTRLLTDRPVVGGLVVWYSHQTPTHEQCEILATHTAKWDKSDLENVVRYVMPSSQWRDGRVSYEGKYLVEFKIGDYKLIRLVDSGSGCNGPDVHLANQLAWLGAMGIVYKKTFLNGRW